MIKVTVMLLSIMTILCMLYPIRPGYRNRERISMQAIQNLLKTHRVGLIQKHKKYSEI